MCQKLIYDLKNMIFDFNNFHLDLLFFVVNKYLGKKFALSV